MRVHHTPPPQHSRLTEYITGWLALRRVVRRNTRTTDWSRAGNDLETSRPSKALAERGRFDYKGAFGIGVRQTGNHGLDFGGIIIMKKLLLLAAGAAVLAFGSIALAQWEPHPHLRAAHAKVEEAVGELRAANDGTKQFGGHRDRAEQLLLEAENEIKEAAIYANSHH
jgi:hypothetical protein